MNKRELSFFIMMVMIIGLTIFIVWVGVDKKHTEGDAKINSIVTPIIEEQENVFNEMRGNTITGNTYANTLGSNTVSSQTNTIGEDIDDNSELPKINVKIGNQTFTATLYNSKATREFIKTLPLRITMSELNGNEKYSYISREFTQKVENVKNIESGDIMLYGSNCLVLFYKDFETIYQYTKIGKIDNPTELEQIVGEGNVEITFSIAENSKEQ